MIQVLNFCSDFRSNQGHSGEIQNLPETDFSEVDTRPGVYIIASRREKFLYPSNHTSKVLYIGKADNLKRRLQEHRNHLNMVIENPKKYWYSNKYSYMNAFRTRVYFYYARQSQEAKEMEADLIWRFYNKYEAIPISNAARSFSKK